MIRPLHGRSKSHIEMNVEVDIFVTRTEMAKRRSRELETDQEIHKDQTEMVMDKVAIEIRIMIEEAKAELTAYGFELEPAFG